MARKKTGKLTKRPVRKNEKILLEDTLPQNILPIGEKVEEDKRIYISQAVYKEIHKFTKNKTTNESGGMLIGNVIEEFGKTNIIIQGFVEAKYSEATPTTLKFTHETWDYVHAEIEKRYENGSIVGWIHTHPDFGIFLSEYDKFIQENFFKEENQIAYVVDPIQHIEGFYFWINGKIERCKGFYIFDKTGVSIDIDKEDELSDSVGGKSQASGKSLLTYILAAALAITIIAFGFVTVNLMNRMAILETQQENLVDSANQSILFLQQRIGALETELADLQSEIDEYHPTEETESDVNMEEENTDSMENTETSAEANGEVSVDNNSSQEAENE